MDVKDGNSNPTSHTPNESIEINDDYMTTIEVGANCDNLLIDKVYATKIDDTQLYEQPQTAFVLAHHFSFE